VRGKELACFRGRPRTGGQRLIDQKDVVDPILAPRVDDRLLGAEHLALPIESDEKRVLTLRHVVDDAGRQAEQAAVSIDRVVEPPARQQISAGKHDVADRAVGKREWT
jgi:hypothetical protein